MADIPSTPSSIVDLNVTDLRRIAWDKNLREESVRPSMFTHLAAKTSYDVTSNEVNIEQSGIMLDISNVGKGSGQSVRVAMVQPLKTRPRYGTGEAALGEEEDLPLLHVELFYNEIKKPVKYFKWGFFHNDTEYLGYMRKYGFSYPRSIVDYVRRGTHHCADQQGTAV